jgi:pro-apoptotic serine protease NMA111
MMMNKTALLAVVSTCLISTAQAEAPEWVGTLERISSGVVSIRIDSTRAFDTEWNSSSQATGFVVDAERGLILTNRHVVTPGPVVAEAIFLNNEEVRLTPIYRDPVHDFGFFRYDPKQLHYIQPSELPLVPDAAAVGREIRFPFLPVLLPGSTAVPPITGEANTTISILSTTRPHPARPADHPVRR